MERDVNAGLPAGLASLPALAAAAAAGKHPDLLVRQAQPFNAGPPLGLLCQWPLTPTELFYVRNHGDVPALDAAGFVLEVGRAGAEPARLGLAELQAACPAVTVPATLQCAGNRRQELMDVRPIAGELAWGADAISHAEWTGARLSDVLRLAGLEVGPADQHVAFDGLDHTERQGRRFTFGGSIPIEKALAPEVVLAYGMNGRPLLPTHGHPLRVVVPGYIGARSVKWLARITLQPQPSDNYFQAHAYRLFPPEVNAANVVWETGAMLGPTAVTSVIGSVTPIDGQPAGRVRIRGYAVAAAGSRLARVLLSVDGGHTWASADLAGPPEPWSWRLWQAEARLAPGRHTLVVRAEDEAGNSQPPDPHPLWNFKGYMNNAWHRVQLELPAPAA